jgi:hypothetical protein
MNPESVFYSIDKTPAGNSCVVVTTQAIDWNGTAGGPPSKTTITIQDIEQLVGFVFVAAIQNYLRRYGARF